MLSPGTLIRNLTPLTPQRRNELRLRIGSLVASNWFWLAIIAALTLVLYGPILGQWFQSDDFVHLRAGRFIGPIGFIREAFDFTGYDKYDQWVDFLRDDSVALPFLAYRPLTVVTIEGQYLVFGENPLGYHVVSLLVHLANVLVVWFIAMRLLKNRPAAHLSALIFALHPAYIATVSWISDVGTLLGTLSALLSLLFFMKSRDTDPPGVNWFIASFYLFGASVFFHQQTLSWAAVFVVYFFLLDRNGVRDRWNPRRWIVLLPFLALAALAFYIQREILADTPANEQGFAFGSHMLTQFKDYASTAIFPAQFDWSTVHFIAFISFLVILASIPVMTRTALPTRLRPELTLFIVVWYLAAVAPLLTPVLAIPGLFARKLYVAGPSLAILLVASGMVLMDLVPARLTRQARVIGVILLIAAVIGAFSQGITTRDRFGETAQLSRDFIQSLQAAHPALPEGERLYVVNPPLELAFFDDAYLVSIVQAFYGKVRVMAISDAQATAIERSYRVRPAFLGPPPTIFRYEGP